MMYNSKWLNNVNNIYQLWPPEAVIFTDASAIPSQDAGVINESKIVTNCSTQISPPLNSKPRFSSAPNADNISMSLKVDVIVISAQSPLPPIGLKQILLSLSQGSTTLLDRKTNWGYHSTKLYSIYQWSKYLMSNQRHYLIFIIV